MNCDPSTQLNIVLRFKRTWKLHAVIWKDLQDVLLNEKSKGRTELVGC